MLKKLSRTALCFLLIAVMLVPAAGCGKKNKNEVKIDKNTIYKEVPIEIDFGNDFSVSQCKITDDKILFYGNSWNEDTQESVFVWGTVNIDGTDFKKFSVLMNDSWVSDCLILNDGNIAFMLSETTYDDSDPMNYVYETKYYALLCDQNGKEIAKKDLSKDCELDWIQSSVTLKDGFLVSDGSHYVKFDNKLNVIKKASASDINNYYNFISTPKGDVFVSYWGEETEEFAKFDTETFTLGDKIEVGFNILNMSVRAGSGKYDLILTDSSQLYGYNIGDKDATPIMNFINSDVLNTRFMDIKVLDDNSILAISSDWDSYTYDRIIKLSKFVKVDPDNYKEKTVLSLGCLWLSSSIRQDIIEFNKNSDEYRITIIDYSQYNTDDDYSAGNKKFNSDIASGQCPDIIIAEDSSMISNYVSKGLFADLKKLMSKDGDVSIDDLVPSVVEACSYDGKLYTIVPQFNINTVIGSKRMLGGKTSWTFDEFLAFEKSLPEGTSMFQELVREEFFYSIMNVVAGDYIDMHKASCYFNTPEFVSLLNYIKKLPTSEEYYNDDYWENWNYEENETAFRTGKAVLLPYTIYSLYDYKCTLRGVFGEEITCIGYPCREGNGSSIYISNCMAISAKSKNQDAAWDFVKRYVSEEYQKEITWGLPSTQKRFDELCEELKYDPYYIDYDTGEKVEYKDTYYIGGQEIEIDPLTDAEIKALKDFVYSVTKLSEYNDEIQEIISEDTEPFFAGQKSAEDIVNIIQSRVSIYLKEKQ